MDNEELLRKIPLFSDVGKRDIKRLARGCITRTFQPQEPIVQEGTQGLGLYYVISGKVNVVKKGEQGDRILATLDAGSPFGEFSLLDGRARSADVVAADETECLILTKGQFDTYLKKSPKIAWSILPFLTERLRDMNTKLEDLGEGGTSQNTQHQRNMGGTDFSSADEDDTKEELKEEIKDILLRTFKDFALVRLQIQGFTTIVGCPVLLSVRPKWSGRTGLAASLTLGDVKVCSATGETPYTITVSGTDTGVFDLILLETSSDGTLKTIRYQGVPTKLGNRAILDFNQGATDYGLLLREAESPSIDEVIYPTSISEELLE